MKMIIENSLESVRRSGDKELYRRLVEENPHIKTGLTDKDVLLIRIDGALESGNKSLFMDLTDELRRCI